MSGFIFAGLGQNKQRAVRRSDGSFGWRSYNAGLRLAQASQANRLDMGEKGVRNAARIASGAA